MPETIPTLQDLINSKHLVALMPLLYVASADGELAHEEVSAIRRAHHRHLSAEDRQALDRWLDPENPPSSTELLRVFRHIRMHIARQDALARSSLVELGVQLASHEDDETTRRALEEVAEVLGVSTRETLYELFAPRRPVKQSFPDREPSFDTAAMTRWLDGDYAEDWEAVRALLRTEPFRYRYEMPKAEYRELVMEWLHRLADQGFGLLAYPESVGGAGRMDRFVRVFEALGMFDLSLVVKFGVQFGLFGGAILNLGTKQHHDRYLGDVGRAELPGGFAMTELGHGSNVRDIETVARYDAKSREFVIHTPSVSARKEWIGNAAVHARAVVVFTQLEVEGVEHGVHAIIVPVRDEQGALRPGVRIEDCGHKMGLNGVDNGRIWFDHVRVPRENLLNRYASITDAGHYDSPIASDSRRFFTMLGTLVGGRVSVGAAAVTASKSALAIAVRYGELRRQFGPPGGEERAILDYRTHQVRLLPRLAQTYALHLAMTDLQARWRDHEGDDTRELDALAAGLKAMATWHAIDTAQQARECCGGMGFLTVNRISEIRKDVDVFATFEGDNIVLLQLVARGLLTSYARELKNNLVGTLLKQVGRRAAENLIEKSPFNTLRTATEHLLDPRFHEQAFAFRTHNRLIAAARRIKKRVDAGVSAFDAFNDIQDHLVELATSHMEEHVHKCFVEAVDGCSNASLRPALEKMRQLYAVWRLHEGAAWFQENNYMDSPKARALRRLVVELCADVRPMALDLVNGFGIPDETLAAPIAFENYAEHAMLAQKLQP